MKAWVNIRIKISVFFHYLPSIFKGELSIKQFIIFIKRLLLFLSKLQHNKFGKMKDGIRLDLYVPTFPTTAFYTACDKFKVFGQKLPCTGALISITFACMYQCEHCYQRLDKGKDVDIHLLVDTVMMLQDKGIAFFNIEGGEPFLRYDRLKAVCDAIDKRSELWINTTGYGMGNVGIDRLKKLNITAVMFSLHSSDPGEFNIFMGNDQAWDHLQEGIDMCHEAGIPVALNTCLMKDAFYDGTFERIMDYSRMKKVCLIQIIKPKSAGAWLGHNVDYFSDKDIQQLKDKVHMYNSNKKYALYPPISAQVIEEEPEVFGCTAGGTDRFYMNAKGDVQPCEFLNISFGNINDEEFDSIYAKMRKCFEEPGVCMLCEKVSKDIDRLFIENKLTTLPLPPKLSEEIYNTWDRGEPTDLYKRMD